MKQAKERAPSPVEAQLLLADASGKEDRHEVLQKAMQAVGQPHRQHREQKHLEADRVGIPPKGETIDAAGNEWRPEREVTIVEAECKVGRDCLKGAAVSVNP